MIVCVSAKRFILCITHSLQNNIKQGRKCVYNAIFEARSDISYAQLVNGMTVTSLPWQPQCTLIRGVQTERYSKKTHSIHLVKCPLFSSDYNQTDFSKPPQ
jgi:hypothetical protein